MRGRLGAMLGVALTSLAFVAPAAAEPASDGDDAAAVLDELNFARTHPQEYALQLLLQPVSPWEEALRAAGDTEDEAAFDEAVDFLMRQKPLPPLQADGDLAAAAIEHVALQGPDGEVGHSGPSGERFDARLRRHGVAGATVAENIAYGPPTASDVVRELIIDRGVASRGHRRNIFTATLETAGVKCGPHKVYNTMCVIDFASRSDDNGWRQASLGGGGGFAVQPGAGRLANTR